MLKQMARGNETRHTEDIIETLKTMSKRLDSIRDMSSGKALLKILLKLFESAIKLKVNRQRLIDVGEMESASEDRIIEEQGHDQAWLSLMDQCVL